MFSCRLALTVLVVILPLAFTQTDYCDKSLCPEGRHIGCNNNGDFQYSCGNDAKVIPMTDKLRNQILHKHNSLRNQMAGGYDRFPKAACMATMRWNKELAQLAELNVKQCQMRHDECRNTKKFKNAGQNLAYDMWYGDGKPLNETMLGQIQRWFDEYKYCPVSAIHSLPSHSPKTILHFTTIVQEKSTAVGCAAVLVKKGKDQKTLFLACNYALLNMVGEPVYQAGPAASKCDFGTNPDYPFLCSLKQKYNI